MQFHRLQNISVTIQMKENVSVLPSGSEWPFSEERGSNMFSVRKRTDRNGGENWN